MRKVLGLTVLALAIGFTGCAQKGVVLDSQENLGKYSSSNDSNKISLDGGNGSIVTDSLANDSRLGSDVGENGVVSNGEQNSLNSKFSKFSEIPGIENIFFAFNEYSLTDDNRQIIKNNAKVFKKLNIAFKIEGNCDEWGSDEYNFALGLKRAKAAKDALVDEGLEDAKITTVSLGESNPKCTAKTDECWQQNRRAEFVEVK